MTAATPEDQLFTRVRGGLVWSLANAGSARILSVISGMVIARFVTPRQFGAYAVGLLVLAAITSMNEMGVTVAIQRWPTDPSEVAPTASAIAIGVSLVIFVAVFSASSDVASALGNPGARTVIRLISLNVVLDGISSVPAALLSRSFLQRRRTVVDLIAFVPGAAVSIGLTAAGAGAIGLAWGSLAGNLTAVIAVYVVCPQRPLPAWNPDHARSLTRLGLPFAATSAIYLATLNVDYVVVGRILGPTALGLYLLAFNISSWGPSLLTMAVRRVSIPAFARLADDREALNRAAARSLHLVAAAAFFVAVPLGMLAQPIVQILYGARWLPAVPALRWLAVLGGVRLLMDISYDLLVGIGRGRALLGAQLVWLGGLILVLPVAARHGGIREVGIGHVLVAGCLVAPVYAAVLRRSGLKLVSMGSAIAVPLLAGAGAAGVIAAGLKFAEGPWTRLGLLGVCGAVVYCLLLCMAPDNRTEVRRMLAGERVGEIPLPG